MKPKKSMGLKQKKNIEISWKACKIPRIQEIREKPKTLNKNINKISRT